MRRYIITEADLLHTTDCVEECDMDELANMLRSLPELPSWDDFSPTPEQVNALPPRLREYIHGLEARSDPSGDVRENIIARDTSRALELELAAKDAEIEWLMSEYREAIRIIKQGKAQFAPDTTNSDADMFLRRAALQEKKT